MQALLRSQETEWCICPHQDLTGVNLSFFKSMFQLEEFISYFAAPLMKSWVKKKKVKHEDADRIRKLFEESFADLYRWCAITLHFVMDCIQVKNNFFKTYNFKESELSFNLNIFSTDQLCAADTMHVGGPATIYEE